MDVTGRQYIYGVSQDKNGAPYLFNLGELVRCKDCRHHFYDKGNEAWFCYEHEYGEVFNDYDFCSWAERKSK